MGMTGFVPYLDRTGNPSDLHSPSKDFSFDGFHAGSGPGFEKLNQCRPIEWRAIGQMNNDPGVRVAHRGCPMEAAKRRG